MLSSLLQSSINIHLPGAGASLNYIVDSSHYWPPPAYTHGHMVTVTIACGRGDTGDIEITRADILVIDF